MILLKVGVKNLLLLKVGVINFENWCGTFESWGDKFDIFESWGDKFYTSVLFLNPKLLIIWKAHKLVIPLLIFQRNLFIK